MIKKRHQKILIPVLAGLAVTVIVALIRSSRKHYLDEHEAYLGGDDTQRRAKIRRNAFRRPVNSFHQSWE